MCLLLDRRSTFNFKPLTFHEPSFLLKFDFIFFIKVEEVHPMGRTCDANLDIQGVKLPEDLDLLRGFLKRLNSKKEEPVELKMTPDNSLGVSIVPQEPGEHQINVRKKNPDRNWRDVPGSPLSVVVVAPEAGNAIERPCGVGLDIPGLKLPDDYKFLRASLKRPSGKPEEPLPLALNSDNTLSVSFPPSGDWGALCHGQEVW